jgi:hypothetical protein
MIYVWERIPWPGPIHDHKNVSPSFILAMQKMSLPTTKMVPGMIPVNLSIYTSRTRESEKKKTASMLPSFLQACCVPPAFAFFLLLLNQSIKE